MRDHVRAERYTFREWKEFDQSYNRAKFLWQECISKADWPYSVHGSHRLLRSCKIRDDRHGFSYLDSNVEHGKYRVERELVSTESSTGKEISLFFRIEKRKGSKRERFEFQINVALHASTSDSIVITDELDRGTSEMSGLSLVAAILNTFAERDSNCPHVFAATHAYGVLALLPQISLIEIQVKMTNLDLSLC